MWLRHSFQKVKAIFGGIRREATNIEKYLGENPALKPKKGTAKIRGAPRLVDLFCADWYSIRRATFGCPSLYASQLLQDD